jgi:nicotinamidase-related amidase
MLTGIAGHICVLFTPNDAHMRDFPLVLPADCVASETGLENRRARGQQARSELRARVQSKQRHELHAKKRRTRSSR